MAASAKAHGSPVSNSWGFDLLILLPHGTSIAVNGMKGPFSIRKHTNIIQIQWRIHTICRLISKIKTKITKVPC